MQKIKVSQSLAKARGVHSGDDFDLTHANGEEILPRVPLCVYICSCGALVQGHIPLTVTVTVTRITDAVICKYRERPPVIGGREGVSPQ